MSLTFLAKSNAYSWKISLLGHVLWKRICVAPWADAIIGKLAAVAVPAATAVPRNFRRADVAPATAFSFFFMMLVSIVINKGYFLMLQHRSALLHTSAEFVRLPEAATGCQ
nr:hypothetical protein [uncultured Noviherbaspirillum sp.]